LGVAKVGECERELSQHLPTTKSGGILRLCYRRNHDGYALAEGVKGCIVGSGGRKCLEAFTGRVPVCRGSGRRDHGGAACGMR
jgi:hypothetical protein